MSIMGENFLCTTARLWNRTRMWKEIVGVDLIILKVENSSRRKSEKLRS